MRGGWRRVVRGPIFNDPTRPNPSTKWPNPNQLFSNWKIWTQSNHQPPPTNRKPICDFHSDPSIYSYRFEFIADYCSNSRAKNDNFAFSSPLWGLRGNVRCSFYAHGKAHRGCLFVLEISVFEGVGQFRRKFEIEWRTSTRPQTTILPG